jgi:hypothetical protein
MRPLWTSFKKAYPDYITFPDGETVKKEIGSFVNDSWIKNTCAVRMSRGLNYSGVPVPPGFPGLNTVKGGDHKHYAFRVAELRKWIPTAHALGKPDFEIKKKQGVAFDKNQFATTKGIIAFDIHFSDATGHFDAWDGSTFSHESGRSTDFGAATVYWALATKISLWVLK